jgi:DNA-binding PadR family transcriptional regulator
MLFDMQRDQIGSFEIVNTMTSLLEPRYYSLVDNVYMILLKLFRGEKDMDNASILLDPLEDLETEVLNALLFQSKPEKYGREIINDFPLVSKRGCKIDIGTLFAILAGLEDKNLVVSRMQESPVHPDTHPRRKYFSVTPKGIRYLAVDRTPSQEMTVLNLKPI